MKFLGRILLVLALLFGGALSPVRADLLNTGVGSAAAPQSCSEATTFLARTSGLDATHTAAYTMFICGLVANSLWSGFDILYVLSTQDATTAALNLPSTSFGLTPVNTPTFTADRGYAGNGTTSYLSTNWNASTNGVQFTQNSASFGVWSLTDKTAANTFEMGTRTSTTNVTSLDTKDTTPNFRININAADSPRLTASNTDGTGFYTGNRSASNAIQSYKNGASVATASTVSSAVDNNTMFIDARNVGAPEGFSVTQVSIAFAGRSFSATEQAILFNLACSWQKAVGAASC